MKCKLQWIGLCFIILFTQSIQALQERHLIIIRHGQGEHNLTHEYNTNPKHPHYKEAHLTDKGQEQVKQTAEVLLNYGFDNRSIAAVYVSPLPRTVETAEILAEIGVFDKEKIHLEPRLIETQAGDREGLNKDKFTKDSRFVGIQEAKSYHGESNEDVRKRAIAIYDDVEKQHPEGHVIFVTHGMPAMELIDALTKNKVKLETAQVYLMPLSNRNKLA
jgi:broad specificity phosphatase PhoE